MSKGDRSAIFAIGLVAGVAVALFFFVWAFPWFSDPSQNARYCKSNDSHCVEQHHNQQDSHFWVRPFHGWLYAEDSLAQWLMAGFGVLATGVSLWAVVLVRDTLRANTDAVAIARDSIDLQKNTSMRELRAYVCVHNADILEPEDRVGFSASIMFTNFGQTPAHNVRIRCREVTIRPDAIRSQMLDFVGIAETEPVVIGPTATFSKGIHNVLEEAELTAIQKEEFVIWVYGDVRYKDVFDRNWVTTFCLRVWRFGQPSERIGPCEFGNAST